MRIYYAHHLWKYNTPIEAWELSLIAERFPGCEIINPNGAAEQGRQEEEIMQDCLRLVRSCDALVFSSLSGVVGLGVLEEIYEARSVGLPVWYIHHGRVERPRLRFERIKSKTNRIFGAVWCEREEGGQMWMY